jgi:hypothetical protein
METNPDLNVDKAFGREIMTPEDVSQFLQKSLSWVYKHWQALGGVKLGGSLLFPSREDLYVSLFCKREGVEVRLHPERQKVHGRLVQNQERGSAGRGKKKRGVEQSEACRGDSNRHGLLGAG